MDDETLQMYVEESREHLEDIENDLLTIEADGDDINIDLVNKVFRAAHSMKGGAGFLGLNNVKELAHKIENVLDMIRNNEIVPNPEIVNIILLAFDRLSELIENIAQSDDMDITEHVVALTGVATDTMPDSEKDSIVNELEIKDSRGRKIFDVSEFDLNQARKGGKIVYLLEFDLIRDVHRKDKKPLDLIKDMQSTGSILDLKVDIEGVGTLDDDEFSNRIPLFILFSSIIEPDIVNTLFDLEPDMVIVVDEQTTSPQASAEENHVETEDDTLDEPESIDEFEQVRSRVENMDEHDLEDQDEETEESIITAEDIQSFAQDDDEIAIKESEKVQAADQKPQPPKAEEKPPKAPPKDQKTAPISAKSVKPRAAKPAKPAAARAQAAAMPESLRVHVSLLENLMNLAGELVLSRNQLMQAISTKDDHSMGLAGQRIDLVTSELQEAIMLTRMQPVANIFNKFPRVVRDLSQDLGKDIDLILEGKDVELDKTIIEGLSDPLTHLVRNSADHGVEMPDARVAAGKKPQGKIILKAFHAAGQVNIEIIDDGKGIPVDKIISKALSKGLITEEQVKSMSDKDKTNLIFLPGLSTADQVSDVSGRGVGMDVVKSNLDRLGGQVDIETEEGKGTSIRIKLPLTLAIIPSLLISVGDDRFAIPQVNVDELIQIPANLVGERIEKVGDAQVLILRGELIPLMTLSDVLHLKNGQDIVGSSSKVTHISKGKSKGKPEKQSDVTEPQVEGSSQPTKNHEIKQITGDVDIVVVSAGSFKYGLVVDELHDSVEIVVKPLGRHLKGCDGYAGATIMGDGRVALILDVIGLARLAELSTMAGTEKAKELARQKEEEKEVEDRQSLFLFNNGPKEYCAVPLDLVARVELIKADQIEIAGGKKVIQYRGGNLPIFALEEVANVNHLELEGELVVIVFFMAGHEIGLLAAPPVDAIETKFKIDDFTLKQPGISGSMVLNGKTTLIVDIFEFMETLNPHWFAKREVHQPAGEDNHEPSNKILLVEDSDFFRAQVKKFIEDEGYEVVKAAEDGQVAWDYLNENLGDISLVVTDLEMPVMDGFELTELIKNDDRFRHLPVLALTSLAGEEDVNRGKQVGIDDYQIKLDKEKLMQSIFNFLNKKAA
ncbi:hybrid sensor histidine kinase/response regulator [Desulfonatronovibrio magnus]|uniref:hybrid sensor histidine kinase/response regulator n=1 Tax=Desulfonatronovibrio magnus TaxID=698827 RepID=UPI0005EB3430|nr:hybrid sensor histidine kinase/response regulator [Desulfonatronovibrio magnus]